MVFNSLTFLVFFAVLLVLHRLPFSWTTKKVNLLLASYVFYAAWNPPFILLLWASTIVDWFIARGIYAARDKSRAVRRSWLVISVAVNIGFIGFFKYGAFLMHNWQALMASFGVTWVAPEWNIVLPVGISFYTFVTLSYTLDVYLGRLKPIDSFLNYALFVTFFPHLVAGPIVRPTQLTPQFETPRQATRDQMLWGAGLIVLGLFEKVVVADAGLSNVADRVFGAEGPDRISGRLARHARVLRPDLLRLRGLLDDRRRRCALPRIRVAGQLPDALRGDRLLRFLASLAHLAVDLAARLPLHPARRQSRDGAAHLRQPDADDAARRALARRQLDLRGLGRIARPLSRGRALDPGEDRCRGRARGTVEPPRARAPHVYPREPHLGVLPGA